MPPIPIRWSSLVNALRQAWRGHRVYGNPPFVHQIMLDTLRHGYAEFLKAPLSSQFLLILPRYFCEHSDAQALLAEWDLLEVIPRGSAAFLATGDKYMGPTRWDTFVVGLGYGTFYRRRSV